MQPLSAARIKTMQPRPKRAPHRRSWLWLVVGALVGAAFAGLLTGLVLLFPAAALGLSLSNRGSGGADLALPGFGIGAALLLVDEAFGDVARCTGTSSCAGQPEPGAAPFWFFVALAVVGGAVGAYRRRRPQIRGEGRRQPK